MFDIARTVSRSVVSRIQSGKNANDAPSLPLTDRYKATKVKKGLNPVRDWKFTGWLGRDIQVLSASSNRAVIGATAAINIIKIRKNNRRERTFSMSPENKRVFLEIARTKRGIVNVKKT